MQLLLFNKDRLCSLDIEEGKRIIRHMTEPIQKEPGLVIHETLATSYLVNFAGVFIGFVTDYIYPLKFDFMYMDSLGALLIVLGTILVYWAQKSSRKGSETRNVLLSPEVPENVEKDNFRVGPYKITRSPTQYGLSIMALGLSFIFGSITMVVLTIACFLIGKFVFIRKEEKNLAKKYGEPYLEYKKHVKL